MLAMPCLMISLISCAAKDEWKCLPFRPGISWHSEGKQLEDCSLRILISCSPGTRIGFTTSLSATSLFSSLEDKNIERCRCDCVNFISSAVLKPALAQRTTALQDPDCLQMFPTCHHCQSTKLTASVRALDRPNKAKLV